MDLNLKGKYNKIKPKRKREKPRSKELIFLLSTNLMQQLDPYTLSLLSAMENS